MYAPCTNMVIKLLIPIVDYVTGHRQTPLKRGTRCDSQHLVSRRVESLWLIIVELETNYYDIKECVETACFRNGAFQMSRI